MRLFFRGDAASPIGYGTGLRLVDTGPMLAVRRLRPDDWALYRDLRLRALADAPDAFCSTLARERAFPDSLWRDRLLQAEPASSCPLVATFDGAPCALVRVMTSRERADVAELFQMWVAPEARGHGIGRRLLDAAAGWAAASGHAVLALECMRDNRAAMRLYADCGFSVSDDADSRDDDRAREDGCDAGGRGEAPDDGTRTAPTPVRLERALVPAVEPAIADTEREALVATLDFLSEAGRLKDVLRSGHTNAGRRESTAEHTWRLCLWIVALGERIEGLDVRRLLELAVVHDLGEALNGDTPAPSQALDPGREARERRDLHTLTEGLPGPAKDRLRALWEEYEAATTPEGRLVRGLDKLETMLQHADGTNPADFDYAFNLDYGRMRTDATSLTRALRELVDAATQRRAEASTGGVGEGENVGRDTNTNTGTGTDTDTDTGTDAGAGAGSGSGADGRAGDGRADGVRVR